MSKAPHLQVVIPETFKRQNGRLLDLLFNIRVPGFFARVVDSGNTWVELATTSQGATVKFGVLTDQPVRFYPGSTITFDLQGNLLSIPDLARSKRPKLLPVKTSRAPTRNLNGEALPGKIAGKPVKGLGF